MALALNNLKRVDMPLKQRNQTFTILFDFKELQPLITHFQVRWKTTLRLALAKDPKNDYLKYVYVRILNTILRPFIYESIEVYKKT